MTKNPPTPPTIPPMRAALLFLLLLFFFFFVGEAVGFKIIIVGRDVEVALDKDAKLADAALDRNVDVNEPLEMEFVRLVVAFVAAEFASP
jgi:hypothetical protein